MDISALSSSHVPASTLQLQPIYLPFSPPVQPPCGINGMDHFDLLPAACQVAQPQAAPPATPVVIPSNDSIACMIAATSMKEARNHLVATGVGCYECATCIIWGPKTTIYSTGTGVNMQETP
jgi:ferredoxin-like protein FixX